MFQNAQHRNISKVDQDMKYVMNAQMLIVSNFIGYNLALNISLLVNSLLAAI